jgi:hypothetical protein
MDDAYNRVCSEVLEHFNVLEDKGLADISVQAALQKYGKNGMLWLTQGT